MSEILAVIISGVVAVLFCIGLPIGQYLDYKSDAKKYGKEMADQIAERY